MKKKTIHLVYVRNSKIIKNPYSIGNNLYAYLRKFYKIKFYKWDTINKINPDRNDILIGHSHPNPYTVFRLSMKNKKWSKVILLQPFTTNLLQVGFLINVLPYCDLFISICGKFWHTKIKDSKFKIWNRIIKQIDMGIDRNDYPFIKKKFNEKKKRKFLYIGNSTVEKNLNYLSKLAKATDSSKFSSIGANVEGIRNYGYLNLKKKFSLQIIKNYDFLILTSSYDANPTVILEALSFGLIPVVTNECGFSKMKGIINIDLKNIKKNQKLIFKLQNVQSKNLKKIQKYGSDILQKSTWDKFCKKILMYIRNTKKIKKIKLSREAEFQIFNIYKNSTHFHLKFINIFNFLMTNIKYYLIKSNR